jgi:hypothetical protein
MLEDALTGLADELFCILDEREVLRYFAYCGGIGAEVVSDGVISVHDPIVILDAPTNGCRDADLPDVALVELADDDQEKHDAT